jgi:hypothetical protein
MPPVDTWNAVVPVPVPVPVPSARTGQDRSSLCWDADKDAGRRTCR